MELSLLPHHRTAHRLDGRRELRPHQPSELSPATSGLIEKLVTDTFDPSYIAVAQGGVETATAVLAEKFDFIFYTGSTAIGRVVMTAAAKHLTPVALELGGKSPAIVEATRGSTTRRSG